ncbi:hypothetical protein D3C81_653090 [compost metagenome]
MLRPGMLLALSPTGTSVDTLLRTDFAIRKYPSYAGAWPLPRPDFHRLEDACLWARRDQKSRGSNIRGLTISPDARSFIHAMPLGR